MPSWLPQNVGLQLERRVAFRRAMKEAVARAMRMGALAHPHSVVRSPRRRRDRAPRCGIARVACRCTTLRAEIGYGLAQACTTYGVIGVKVWIFRGEVISRQEERQRQAVGAS